MKHQAIGNKVRAMGNRKTGELKFGARAKLPAASLILLAFLIVMVFQIGGAEARSLPKVERIVLPNDLVLLISEEHSLPFVVFEMLVDAGSRRDPPGSEGLAHFTAKGLLLGTSQLSNTAMNQTLDFLGASLTASTTRDYSVLRLQVLKKDLHRALELFMQTLTAPVFPEEELQKLKKRTLGDIRAEEEQPLALADKIFQRILFPDSPYGHPVEGTPESVTGLRRDDAVNFYRSFYRPNNSILAIVGDVTVGEVRQKIAPLMKMLQKGRIPDSSFTAGYAKGPKEERIDRKITQVNIIIGNEGPKRSDPDYYAAVVMNYILGGGSLQSRLLEEIRVKRGLAYSVMSTLEPEKYQGSLRIMVQTKKASASEAISLVRREMERMGTETVSDQSLQRTKKYLIGNFPLRLDTQSELAGILTRVEYYGLGLDYLEKYPSLIRSVTKRDVLRAARRYLRPGEAIVVMVGDLDGAQPNMLTTPAP